MQAKVWDSSPIVTIYYGFAPLRFEFGKSQFICSFILFILCLISLKCHQSSFVPSVNYIHYHAKPFSKPPLCAHQEVYSAEKLKQNSPDNFTHLTTLFRLLSFLNCLGQLTPSFCPFPSLLSLLAPLPLIPYFLFLCSLLTTHLFSPLFFPFASGQCSCVYLLKKKT